MDNETLTIFEEQLGKLPQEVVTFLASSGWVDALDEIGARYQLSEDELDGFKNEVLYILAGLVHPDALKEELGVEVRIKEPMLDTIVTETQKLIEPVYPALVKFFIQEQSEAQKEEAAAVTIPAETPTETVATPIAETPVEAPVVVPPNIVPENLPTDDELDNPFIPKLIPKAITPEVPAPSSAVHPFEEKMQQSFTPAPVIEKVFTPEIAPATKPAPIFSAVMNPTPIAPVATEEPKPAPTFIPPAAPRDPETAADISQSAPAVKAPTPDLGAFRDLYREPIE